MRIKYIAIAILGSIFLIMLSDCNRKKEILYPPITKICLESQDCNKSGYPDIAIEIDSSLTYKFFEGDNGPKKGFWVGTVSKELWDTLQEKFINIKYWNIKESYEDYMVCDEPPPPYGMRAIIHYGKEIKHIDLLGAPYSILNVFNWLMNSYKNVDLKILPADKKLSFEIQLPDTQKIYSCFGVMQKPTFRNSQDSLFNYLSENINYPKKEKKEGIETTVYVTFIIEKNGSVSNAKIVRDSIGREDFNMEVLRVINSMPKWNPAENHGIPVRVQMILPIHFKLY